MGSDQGTRNAALRLLRQADINGADASPELAAQRRTEIARVLALPELTQTAAWLASSSSSEGGESFSTDLTRYLAATPDGGFAQYNTSDRAVLKSWPSLGDGGPPALRLHLSPDEKLAAVICAGDSNAPALVVVVSVVNGRRLHEWPCDPVSREWPLWLPDGGFLFANSRMSCVRSDAGGNVRPFPDAARATDMVPLALSPDGTRAVRTPAAP